MKPNYNLCDVCGAKCEEKHRFFIATDRTMDAAGSMDDDGQHFDLCADHLLALVRFLLQEPNNKRVPNYSLGVLAVAELKRLGGKK